MSPTRAMARKGPILRKRSPHLADVALVVPSSRFPGVAEYSARTVAALAQIANVHLVLDGPPSVEIRRHAARVHVGDTSICESCPTIVILGNHVQNRLALSVLDQQWANVAVLHDASLFNLLDSVDYFEDGKDAGILSPSDFAWRERDLLRWRSNPLLVPFPILPRSLGDVSVVVHSPAQCEPLQNLGISATYLPVAAADRFAQVRKANVPQVVLREILGMGPEPFQIVTLGYVEKNKKPEVLINAVRLLQDWGIEAGLTLAGTVHPHSRDHYWSEAERVGISHRVRFESAISDRRYAMLAHAADVVVQLRDPFFGQLSGAVADAFEMALPVMASGELLQAIPDLPEYSHALPAVTSSIAVADALEGYASRGESVALSTKSWERYMHVHSFDQYAGGLIDVLAQAAGQ